MQSCLHDLNIPLSNDRPEFMSSIDSEIVITYPDSVACTLAVLDKNDSIVHFSDSVGRWPGEIVQLNEAVGLKKFLMVLGGPSLGAHEGLLRVYDSWGESSCIGYHISRVFYDSFDNAQLDKNIWRLYESADTSCLAYEWDDKKLRFSFAANKESGEQAAGMRSLFRLAGDFKARIAFELRDDMFSGFETAFFVSTKPDTGRWTGEKAGLFLSGGDEDRVRLQARSVNFQISSRETPIYSGSFLIERTGATVIFECRDMDPRSDNSVFNDGFDYSLDTVYVHLSMKVADLERSRHCSWNNFQVDRGTILF